MSTFVVEVPGVPVPQGSKRVFNGRPVDTNSAKLRPWRQSIVAEARLARPEGWNMAAPMSVVLMFKFPRPKSHCGTKGLKPSAPTTKTTRPDLDKLVRSVLDAGTDAGVWNDDSQVFALTAVKCWVEDGEGPSLLMVVNSEEN